MAPIWPFWSNNPDDQAPEMTHKMASLMLEDGTTYKGKLFGAAQSVPGEVGGYLC